MKTSYIPYHILYLYCVVVRTSERPGEFIHQYTISKYPNLFLYHYLSFGNKISRFNNHVDIVSTIFHLSSYTYVPKLFYMIANSWLYSGEKRYCLHCLSYLRFQSEAKNFVKKVDLRFFGNHATTIRQRSQPTASFIIHIYISKYKTSKINELL